jgi:hypothetical protein
VTALVCDCCQADDQQLNLQGDRLLCDACLADRHRHRHRHHRQEKR